MPEASESWAEESKRETTAKETLPSQPSASSNLVVSNDSNVFKISGEMAENAAVCNSLPAMERAFFSIAEGKAEVIDNAKKQEVFDYIKANQHIGREARQNHKQIVIAYKDTIEEMEKQKICPYCKTELVQRRSKNGEFYGCRNYPKCTYTLKK